MENPWYSGWQDILKEVGMASRPIKRIGDKGPGSDVPQRRRGIDGVKLLFDLLSRRRPGPSEDFVKKPRPPLLELPSMDFEPMQFKPLSPSLKRTDREKLIKAMEESIAEKFGRRVSQGQVPEADVDVQTLLGSRPPIPTLRFERQAPPRPIIRQRAREEIFTDMPKQLLREPWPVQAFGDAERIYDSPPDFRSEGEKRRDVRQAAAKRELQLYRPPRTIQASEPPEKEFEFPEGAKLAGSRGRAVRNMNRIRRIVLVLLREMFKRLPILEEEYGNKGRFLDAFAATIEATVGLTLMTTGIVIAVANILQDILTDGLGVADTPLTMPVAIALFVEGLRWSRIALEDWSEIMDKEEKPQSPELMPESAS